MSYDPEIKPRLLWPLEFERVLHDGQVQVILKDPRGVVPQQIAVAEDLLPIIVRFDGERTVQEIAEEGRQWGVTAQLVMAIAGKLDECLYLEGPRTRQRLAQMLESYRSQPIRESCLSGAVFPASADKLKEMITSWGHASVQSCGGDLGQVVGVVSPHIDYRRGWRAYADVHRLLMRLDFIPEIIVLLGTSHQYMEGRFAFSDRIYRVPNADFLPQRDVIANLEEVYGQALFKDELAHRLEHSLEIQLPIIAHALQQRGYIGSMPEIVPLLCGSFDDLIREGISPVEHPEVGTLLGAMVDIVGSLLRDGKRVLFWAGVDLSHIGQHFGDSSRLTETRLGEVGSRDGQLLKALSSGSRAFFSHMREDFNERRVCGVSSLYMTQAIMEGLGWGTELSLMRYEQSYDSDSDCAVSFASAYWCRSVLVKQEGHSEP